MGEMRWSRIGFWRLYPRHISRKCTGRVLLFSGIAYSLWSANQNMSTSSRLVCCQGSVDKLTPRDAADDQTSDDSCCPNILLAPRSIPPRKQVPSKGGWSNFLCNVLEVSNFLVMAALRTFVLTLTALPLGVLHPLRRIHPRLNDLFWAYLLWFSQSNGPCFVKFMQWASTRPDLFSLEFCSRLSQLHFLVEPHPFGYTDLTLSDSFGLDWREYLSLDPKPLGSGCIAQVYRGKLRTEASGNCSTPETWVDVAIKVLHPNCRDNFSIDLYLMDSVCSLLCMLPSTDYLPLCQSVKIFRQLMSSQLNLAVEAENVEAFRKNFEGKSGVVFPRVYTEVSTPDVLVESYEKGTPVGTWIQKSRSEESKSNHHERLRIEKLRRRIGDVGFKTFLRMVFVDNLIHADLHPGNVLIRFRDDDDKVTSRDDFELIFLDCGITASLGPTDRKYFLKLFRHITSGDGQAAADILIEKSPKQQVINREAFRDKVDTALRSYLENRPDEDGHGSKAKVIGTMLAKMLGISTEHQVMLEPKFLGVLLAIIIAEGLGRQLNPDIDIVTAAIPFVLQSSFS